MAQLRLPHSDDDTAFVRIEIACASTTNFIVHRRKSSMDGDYSDGVPTGDDAFDAQVMARATDARSARAALDPQRRAHLVDWFRQGWIDDIRCRDGSLIIDGGTGLTEGVEVERARLLLQIGIEIADELEREPVSSPH